MFLSFLACKDFTEMEFASEVKQETPLPCEDVETHLSDMGLHGDELVAGVPPTISSADHSNKSKLVPVCW